MRPDRLVLGEVRGAELTDLLAALNTGHEGGCGTVHANSAADLPARLEALAMLGGLAREACHAQIAAAVAVVVHLRRQAGQRLLDQIVTLDRTASGLVVTTEALQNRGGQLVRGPGWARLSQLLGGHL